MLPRWLVQRSYPWWVIGVAFVTVAMAFGAHNAFAVFLIAVVDEFHWSRPLALGVLMLVSVVWVAGRAVIWERFGSPIC